MTNLLPIYPHQVSLVWSNKCCLSFLITEFHYELRNQEQIYRFSQLLSMHFLYKLFHFQKIMKYLCSYRFTNFRVFHTFRSSLPFLHFFPSSFFHILVWTWVYPPDIIWNYQNLTQVCCQLNPKLFLIDLTFHLKNLILCIPFSPFEAVSKHQHVGGVAFSTGCKCRSLLLCRNQIYLLVQPFVCIGLRWDLTHLV